MKPVYFHPSLRNNKPVILNHKLQGSGWKAELTFGYAPTDEEYKELNMERLPKYHPYFVSMAKQGLDIIIHDRVVLFHQLSEIGLVNVRHSDYNLFRGEIDLKEGFSTAITKNFIIQDEHFADCIKKVNDFLTSGDESSPKNYLKQKTYPQEIPEALLRDRLATWLQANPLTKRKDVKTEYTVGGLGGFIDILADGEAWEIKRLQADGLDAYQLFAYMDMGNIDKGYLIAPSFTTGAQAARDYIQSKHKKQIELAHINSFPINHPPSAQERAEYY
jgi:hypothetical protein